MKYHFKIHKEKGGYWAQCIELEGCFTQGDSLEELSLNMSEALNIYVQEPEHSRELASLPDDTIKSTKTVVSIALDPQIAFSFMIRYYRIKHKLTQKQAAKKMGFDNLYSYQRLETKKCNPNLKTLSRIKALFPEFSIDYAIGY